MASIERFEEIAAWQKARELVREIYRVTKSGEFSRDFGLRDQVRRAAVSILSNIAEGFGRGGDKEFMQFLSTAKGSVAEVQAQLYVALDAGYLDQPAFSRLYGQAEEAGRLIGGFMKYLQQSVLKGSKYK
jgi:four helix bundle protein